MNDHLIKTELQIEAICDVASITCRAFSLVENILQAAKIRDSQLWYEGQTLTSESLKHKVESLFLENDLHSPAGMIIASGRVTAEPHAAGTGPILANNLIVVDLFPQSKVSGYFTDMSRTYVKGNISKLADLMWQAVRTAQSNCIQHVAPGVAVEEIYELSVNHLAQAGFEVAKWETGARGYIHALGHGVGKSIHEPPRLSRGDKTILQPGMVITIEPGVYDPKIGGVRIEDTVVVTKDGYEILTRHPYTKVIT